MDYKKLFEQFSHKNILVVGDIMLDTYVFGDVVRISPEAPVPVVNFKDSSNRLGGAANVALNLRSLGASVAIASVVGTDENAKKIALLLDQNEISQKALIQTETRKTTCKTRIISHGHQLIRIDDEQTDDLDDILVEQLLKKIQDQHAAKNFDAIIFEDYNKGVLTQKLIEELITFSKNENIATCVDPKLKNFLTFKGVTLFKPNLKELQEGLQLNVRGNDMESVKNGINKLKEKIHSDITFITLSENGVAIADNDEFHHIEAHIRNVSDVSGAGDTVIAVATLCLVSKLNIRDIAAISNLAGGLVCEKIGVVSIDKVELLNEVIHLLS